MANKQNNADNAVLMAMLQDIQSVFSGNPIGSAASTAAIAQADIKRDRADKQDIHRIVANQMLSPVDKIKYQFVEYPQLADKLGINPEEINETNLEEVAQIIYEYLNKEGVISFGKGGQFETQENWIDVQIGDKMYNLLVAETEEEKERGLMGVIEMDPNEGMLFDYSDDPQASISFWMKDTEIPLDIIFVNQDGIVISVKQGEPLSEEIITEDSEFVSCVIELNVNSGIKPGDKTDLFNDIQSEDSEIEESSTGNNELHVYGSDGEVQAVLSGGERIFSRKSTAILLKKAKLAYETKDDKDYKALGRYAFDEMRRQDGRDPEYVEN